MTKVELDKKFIRKVLNRRGVELDVFIKRYEKYIFGVINKKMGNEGLLYKGVKKDIFQYVCLKLLDKDLKILRDYNKKYEIPFQNFLGFFVSSRITDFLRKESLRHQREGASLDAPIEVLVEEDSSQEAFNIMAQKEFYQKLESFLATLKEEEQILFRYMIEEMSSGEISKKLDIPPNRVYKKVFNLKNKFKVYLKEDQDA